MFHHSIENVRNFHSTMRNMIALRFLRRVVFPYLVETAILTAFDCKCGHTVLRFFLCIISSIRTDTQKTDDVRWDNRTTTNMRKILFSAAFLLALCSLSSCTKTCHCYLPDYAGVGGYAEASTMGKCANVQTVIVNGKTYSATCHD